MNTINPTHNRIVSKVREDTDVPTISCYISYYTPIATSFLNLSLHPPLEKLADLMSLGGEKGDVKGLNDVNSNS